jgi:hypothetical protein
MTDRSPRYDDELRRIVSEYAEMPGLHLTATQAARLWHLEPTRCEALLETLVDQGWLVRTQRGAFIAAGRSE